MVILLVDSDQKSLDREAKRLADCQGAVTVSLYDNANDAIDFARYNDVDIVYSRQTLSDMSGEELIRQIKQIRPRAEGHVLGYGEPVPLQVCQRANANRAEFDRTYSRVGNVRGSMSMKDNEGKDYVEDNGYEINRKGDRPMTERELRSLSRRELLELMIEQGKEIESAQEQYENDLDFLKSELPRMLREGIALRVFGDVEGLPLAVRTALKMAIKRTEQGREMDLNLALNYGARQEILRATRSMMTEGLKPEDVTEESFASHLYSAGQPDPDFIIRTSGEQRLSNFLLFQCAYAELYFTPRAWPDFTPACMEEALADFARRQRRFGKTQEQVDAGASTVSGSEQNECQS